MDVDLTELDEWLGTLEELQLGLGQKQTTLGADTSAMDRTNMMGPLYQSNMNRPFTSQLSTPGYNKTEQFPHANANGRSGISHYERGPESDLSFLLRELELVGERMKELEEENNSLTKRYSVTSPAKPNQSAKPPVTFAYPLCEQSTNGFVSVQWAAQLNRDTELTGAKETSPSPPPPPPAFLGAGDACASPAPTAFEEEAALWQEPKQGNGSLQLDTTIPPPNVFSGPERPNNMHSILLQQEKRQQLTRQLSQPNPRCNYELRPTDMNGPPKVPAVGNKAFNQPSNFIAPNSPRAMMLLPTTPPPVRPNWIQQHPGANLDGNSLNAWSRSVKMNERCNGGSERLSNSLSPASSLSDKSISGKPDAASSTQRARFEDELDPVRKLVVRVFRPDKTTKAVLVGETMTAGEVANLLTEKNFLPPSTSLVVVEKVPALKIERRFEEHEIVAECILAWQEKSQNMIFFEDREDHFGFIESPEKWFDENMLRIHGYNTPDAVKTMLNNLDKTGIPELRDYLYIKKPGEKTWSRRLCVLRNSGLYTSKKNKKVLNLTDLVRILVLDCPLRLYTTTGGWTRMKAPTPYGFAFKPYSATDPSSVQVFCFCATDEKALRNWVCRLRIAKYGKQLLQDYHSASLRVQRLQVQQTASVGGFRSANGSLSALLHRKSSFDILAPSSDARLSGADSTNSLGPQNQPPPLAQQYCQRQPLPEVCLPSNVYNERPTSPMCTRARPKDQRGPQMLPNMSVRDQQMSACLTSRNAQARTFKS